MQITVQVHGVGNGVASQKVQEILLTAVEPVTYRIKQICVYIQDVNGPRGGVDTQCRCVLHFRRLPPVVIRDRDTNLYALVHRVADRVAEAVRRRKDRDTCRAKQAPPRLAPPLLPNDTPSKGLSDELPLLRSLIADDRSPRN